MKQDEVTFADIPNELILKWQGITDLLASILCIPSALIMKAENGYMEVFVSSNSEKNPYHAGDREKWDGLYCETVIKSQQKLLIPNALVDSKWNKNPDIKLGMIAYLGYPINFPDSRHFGTLCVLDNKENGFAPVLEQLLLQFRNVVEMDLAHIEQQSRLISTNNLLCKSDALLRGFMDNLPSMVIIKSSDFRPIFFNKKFIEVFGADGWLGKTPSETFSPEIAGAVEKRDRQAMDAGVLVYEEEWVDKAGETRLLETRKFTIRQDDGPPLLGAIITDITERKRADESLRESEERFHDLFEKAPLGYQSLDHDGKFIEVNLAWLETLGYKREEVTGKWFGDFLAPEYVQAFRERFPIFKAQGQIHSEFYMLHKDGSRRYIAFDGKIGHNTDGSFKQTHCILKDETGRKQLEEALRKSDDNYRLQFLNMNSYNSLYEVVTDKEGKPCDFRFIMVNHSYEKYVGKTASELIGKTLLEVYPATEQYWIDKMAEVALTGVPSSFENFSREMNTYTEINLYVPQTGQLAMITANIDGRKRAEEQLRESEQRFRTAMQHLPGTVWVIDKNLNFTLSQGASLDKMGLKPDQVVGMSLYDFFGTKDSSHPSIAAHLRCLAGETVTYEQIHQDAVFQTSLNPLCGSDGEVRNVLGLAIDVTAQKKAFTEKEKMHEEVNKMQKLESLGILAGGIAHDFNNLLGGIYGYIDMAGEGAKDEKLSRHLSKAMKTIDRARDLTRQLLTFAKGGDPIQEIGQLFPLVEETALFALSGTNVSCHLDVQPDLWACNFDKNQIGQVIDNLVINAQQAMPVGGTIELTARNSTLAEKEHPVLAGGNYVWISLKDSGVGIPGEHLSKIFDPFFTTKAKGHGLGLTTCYSIINRHGGCIDIESEPGKGSTFKVYLPASKDTASSATNELSKPHAGIGTFLVMDDEEVMRDTIGDMLELLGYTVISKENGKDAVDCFIAETKANREFAGMVFDLTIPGGMGGKAAIEEIRKVNREIPAFVASGYADDPVMKNPLKYGFMASICKPFRKSELSEMLNRYLKPTK